MRVKESVYPSYKIVTHKTDMILIYTDGSVFRSDTSALNSTSCYLFTASLGIGLYGLKSLRRTARINRMLTPTGLYPSSKAAVYSPMLQSASAVAPGAAVIKSASGQTWHVEWISLSLKKPIAQGTHPSSAALNSYPLSHASTNKAWLMTWALAWAWKRCGWVIGALATRAKILFANPAGNRHPAL